MTEKSKRKRDDVSSRHGWLARLPWVAGLYGLFLLPNVLDAAAIGVSILAPAMGLGTILYATHAIRNQPSYRQVAMKVKVKNKKGGALLPDLMTGLILFIPFISATVFVSIPIWMGWDIFLQSVNLSILHPFVTVISIILSFILILHLLMWHSKADTLLPQRDAKREDNLVKVKGRLSDNYTADDNLLRNNQSNIVSTSKHGDS